MAKKYAKKEQIRRTNQQWIDELCGRCGPHMQARAIEELARYLRVVVYNDLMVRQSHIARLSQLDNEEISQFAHDFAQQFMEKLVANNYAILQKYHAKGQFTAWASQVTLNLVRSEFRRSRWSVDVNITNQIESSQIAFLPEISVLNGQIYETLHRSMEELPTQMREVFVRLVLQDEKASVIAEEMGVTANTIYLIVHRAKKKIRQFMLNAGYQVQDLAV